MARPDEPLIRSQLHPSVDLGRRDDAACGKVDARHVRSGVLDLVPPRLQPELAEERELLATDHARVTRRCDLVDPARPPIVQVDRVHRAAGRRSADGGNSRSRPAQHVAVSVEMTLELHDPLPAREHAGGPDCKPDVSVPVFVNRTSSAAGTTSVMCFARADWCSVSKAHRVPRSIAVRTAASIAGCRYPSSAAPNDVLRSTYS